MTNGSGPPCMYCGNPVTWVPAYGRYYCEACRQYMPGGGTTDKTSDEISDIFNSIGDEIHGRPTYNCQFCQGRLEFVDQYGRWFCPRCQRYL